MKVIDVNLPHKYIPRDYQKPFFKKMHAGCKRCVLVWNRRAGKDVTSWNFLISEAIVKKGVYYYIFPTFSQGRKAIWDSITTEGINFLEFVPTPIVRHINNQEMKITLVNGSIIQVVGSDNYNAIMGTNPCGCLFSEYSLQNPNAWQYIRPILDANNGWAIFVFTPRGSNHAKDLYDMATHNDKWFCQKLTNKETNTYTEEQVEEMRKEEMTEDMIQQEVFCSFTLGIDGSYYANYLTELWDKKQIGKVPWDKTQKVHTSWDLGIGDSCVIIWWQCCGNEIHLIDYFENHGKGMPYYIDILREKPYKYGTHFAPHDIKAHEFGSGNARIDTASNLGVDFVVLETLKWGVEDSIELVRGMFPRLWIDYEKCVHVVKSLENYRKEYDDIRKIYKNRPYHDKYSHCADAIRYACIAIRDHLQSPRGPSDREVERMIDRNLPRFT